jgi:hypothetical protein
MLRKSPVGRMKVLVACEFSGIVRDAFAAKGHDAWSCDLLPSERNGQHIQGDVLEVLDQGWDLMIGHPPCTDLAVSGAAHFKKKGLGRIMRAADFFEKLLWAPISKICLENPVSVASTVVQPANQIIHPWQFGHEEEKTTCLWLVGLAPLVPTNIVPKGINKLHRLEPSEDRWKLRSKTFQGIADAMADQWGACG